MGELAARQHGVVAVDQLRRLGLAAGAIKYQVRTGRLYRLHRGVYAVGHNDISEEGRFLSAVLAVGNGAVLSHLAAAVLWGFWKKAPREVDVTVARQARSRPGVRVHSVMKLRDDDTSMRYRIPVTTAARTIVDCSQVLTSERALKRLVHEAYVQKRVSPQQLEGRGPARLRAIVDQGYLPTRSGLEDEAIDLLQSQGFKNFQTNTSIEGMEVDVWLPEHNLAIEVDSDRYHSTPFAKENDARKQARLEAGGPPRWPGSARTRSREVQLRGAVERDLAAGGVDRVLDRAEQAVAESLLDEQVVRVRAEQLDVSLR